MLEGPEPSACQRGTGKDGLSRDRTIIPIKNAVLHEGKRQVSDEMVGSFLWLQTWGIAHGVEEQIWRVRNTVRDNVENWEDWD